MNSKMIGLSFLMGIVGCGSVEEGDVEVCSTIALSGEEEQAQVSGVITSMNDGAVDCDQSITVEDDAGQHWSVGFSVHDAAGEDIAVALDLSVGDAVSIEYFYHLVFGEVEGIVVSDEAGLVAAVDEGAWGGALAAAALPFSVARGDEALSSQVSQCLTIDGHEIIFHGDEALALFPVSAGTFTVDGQELMAQAVRSTIKGPGRSCEMSELTSHVTWVVQR